MAFANWLLQPTVLFSLSPVIPVIVVSELDEVLPLAQAFLEGGINVLEITLRSKIALDAIYLLNKELPETIVGAGTVTSVEQLRQCIEVGAKFALSPGSTSELLTAGKQATIPFIPGIASISELMEGMSFGYTHFKLFPAEVVGGVNMLKALRGPFPDVRFCPTGGINEKNFLEYLSLPSVQCVGGSWLAPIETVKQANWQQISENCINVLAQAARMGIYPMRLC